MSKYLDVAIDAAKKAGELVMQYREKGFSQEYKDDGSVVTEADKAAEKLIIETIKEAFPDHAFLGEEGGKTGDAEFCWVIDPIDGTMEYSRGFAAFGIQIAMKQGDEPIVGVVWCPGIDLLMTGEKGEGAFVNGQPAKLANRPLSECVIGFGDLRAMAQKNYLQEFVDLREHIRWQMIVDKWTGFAGLLTGKIDARVSASGKIWDNLPYVVMVREAGGVATDPEGRPLVEDSEGILAANPDLHAELLERFK
jgi:fructose-1,6-bisphosphatase/inositol monophosphatase family enzyme